MGGSTIDFYNKNAREYFESTVHLDMSHLYEPFLSRLQPGSKVLDVGCGSGRDSLFFKNQGYEVTAIDGSAELVKLASQLLEQPVLLMDFQKLCLQDQFDGIWACASLLHLEKPALGRVIAYLAEHLKPGGIFYMSFKYGSGECWKDGRYFNYVNEEDLKSIIDRVPGLSVEKCFVTTDVRRDHEERWLNAYLLKL